ncbi:TRAP transporter small permease [Roseobacter litoralis]|uniref:TRAP transporter small permease n=1 Tax=Roseobacter litoralis TaxID=42443 RepID=UPI0024936FB9|nr:TRAP transporter small permease [Roseobacter litoralis]
MRMFLEGYYRLLKFLITLLMAALIVPVTMQILSRYTGMVPRYIWTEEIARFCFVWIILIGAMIAVRDGTHFDVDVLPHTQNRHIEFASKLFVHLSILVMALSFLWWGRDFFVLGARQQSEISGLPMWMIYVAWPIAGGTWTIFTVERIFDDFQVFKKGVVDGAG